MFISGTWDNDPLNLWGCQVKPGLQQPWSHSHSAMRSLFGVFQEGDSRESLIEGQKWSRVAGTMKNAAPMDPSQFAHHLTKWASISATASYRVCQFSEWTEIARIAGRTHVPGHRYSRSGVEVQEEWVSMVLGSCSMFLSSCRDEMNVSGCGGSNS